MGFAIHGILYFFSLVLSFGRMWQDASSDAGAIFTHIQLLLPRNNFIARHHFLAETAVPSRSGQLFSYGTADQELAAQSTEGKKVRNTGQGEEVHLSPGFGQIDLHNRARQPPPTAASVVCATSLQRKTFSFLAIFSVGSMQLELYTGIPQM